MRLRDNSCPLHNQLFSLIIFTPYYIWQLAIIYYYPDYLYIFNDIIQSIIIAIIVNNVIGGIHARFYTWPALAAGLLSIP